MAYKAEGGRIPVFRLCSTFHLDHKAPVARVALELDRDPIVPLIIRDLGELAVAIRANAGLNVEMVLSTLPGMCFHHLLPEKRRLTRRIPQMVLAS